jgi:glutamate/tyrosine decarboxylase-like PLP-dependent enzyme
MRTSLNELSKRDELLRHAAETARKYVQGIGERRVAPTEKDLDGLTKLREPFPNATSDPIQILEKLDEIGSPATVASTCGRYFGFVIGGTLPASLAASWLAGAWDQNAALRVMSPVAAELEEVVLGWVREALQLPQECEGGLVTCADGEFYGACCSAPRPPSARRMERRG